jgi:hypothetical protein
MKQKPLSQKHQAGVETTQAAATPRVETMKQRILETPEAVFSLF